MDAIKIVEEECERLRRLAHGLGSKLDRYVIGCDQIDMLEARIKDRLVKETIEVDEEYIEEVSS